MTKKEMAKEFLMLAGTGRVKEAYDRFIHADFIHHNQYFRGDRQSLLTAMEEAHKSQPNKSVDIKYTYEDGQTVITHSHVAKDTMDIAVVHIFRFQGDKVIELWDLGMVIDPKSPNEKGLF